jgi:2-keto-4-pentenoate hydratase/2-oxohepta-3-ene-1,7-dioic acid hydratase in catechol pathway
MKLALVEDGRPVVVTDDRVHDLSAIVGDEVMGCPLRDRMAAVITRFQRLKPQFEAAAERRGEPLAGVRLLAPLPCPTKIVCAQGNYTEGVGGPVRPISMFLKAPTSVIGPGGVVRLPPVQASVFQHEAELGMVIGRYAKDVAPAEGLSYVFGYTCFVDVSARGVQQAAAFGDKSFDTFGPMGPWIVTADEIEHPQDLGISLSVSGQPRQCYRTSDMEHPVGALVAAASAISALEPGDLISCGTNHQGLGPVQDGDTIEIEIERVGRMVVSVVDPLRRSWPAEVDVELAAFMRRHRHDPAASPPARYHLGAGSREPAEAH